MDNHVGKAVRRDGRPLLLEHGQARLTRRSRANQLERIDWWREQGQLERLAFQIQAVPYLVQPVINPVPISKHLRVLRHAEVSLNIVEGLPEYSGDDNGIDWNKVLHVDEKLRDAAGLVFILVENLLEVRGRLRRAWSHVHRPFTE